MREERYITHLTMSRFALFFCLLVVTSSLAKTADVADAETSTSTSSFLTNKLLTQLLGENLGMENLFSLFKKLPGDVDGGTVVDKFKSLLLKQLPDFEAFSNVVADGVGLNQHFLKPFVKIVSNMGKLSKKKPLNSKSDIDAVFEFVGQYINTDDEDDPEDNSAAEDFSSEATDDDDSNTTNDINIKFFDLAKGLLESKFGNLSTVIASSTVDHPTELSSLNLTSSNVWMIVKSTWQKVLAYVEEENSLETFMQQTPVRIIDRVLSLGDDVNLVNFLAKKLDPDFAEFLAGEINPFLGPLKDFDSFYNFSKENGLSGIIDYFTSDKFSYSVNMLSRFVSAYLEDTVSDDVVNQYIEFISFNNTDLHNFYKSVLRSQGKTIDTGDSDVQRDNTTLRYKRDVLQNIPNSYKFNVADSDQIYSDTTTNSGRQLQRYGVLGNVGSASSLLYDPSRDGYGGGGGYSSGGGYGGMNMNSLDPYVILGSLALGTILGFLLFRALRGTGGGRRDIGDGSLSLWQSDIPSQILPWGTNVERMKRQVQEKGDEEFNLPDSLRGDVWSTDPLVGDNLLAEELEEDDIADQLNHLWRVYKHKNETACVHSHLCGVIANSTAEQLTGKDSSMALLMASVSNMMGMIGSGQLVDDVTKNLVVGDIFTCPTFTSCHHLL
ncbi:uncharacterized protein LOC121873185 [Homarus americanus]|uniref:Uncharacterized protein n=1 Tax=Homarus americanus TaxID=6706 RepID=A0A8J5MSV6_HOMAM|nr:uncharacterized protein LOC121873185 [Homarus americanus]KAG7162980.1 hypothetical protein Hamer_G002013 [Homarus americanus]